MKVKKISEIGPAFLDHKCQNKIISAYEEKYAGDWDIRNCIGWYLRLYAHYQIQSNPTATAVSTQNE